jgi:uncharacterized protein YecT (DUF1311 family)
MNIRNIGALVIVSVLLASCGPKPFDCTSEQASSVIEKIIREQIEKTSVERGKSDDGEIGVSESKARATVAQLKIVLDLVRTTKSDPNSTKKFCAGTVKVIFPVSMLSEASRAREVANIESLSSLAENSGIKINGNSYQFDIDYSVQPTDDKKNTIGEIENIGSEFIALSEIVNSHILSKRILDGARAAEAEELARKAEEESNIALQKQAYLDLAESENKLANQSINEIWNSLPPEVKQEQLDYQRAWIKEKTAACNVEAAALTTDPLPKETARLACDTRRTKGRADELRNMMNG